MNSYDKGYLDVLCNKSTIAHFTAEKVQTVPVPFPSSAEQVSIAAFLDRETGKIDALIAAQQRLIELLREKRQAVISHAVTKGLDPDVPMKDSGVEWLGEVPEHWVVRPVKSLANEPGSLFSDGDWIESKDLADDGIRYITTGNVGIGIYKEQGSGFINETTFEKLGCTDVLPEDVLISRLNPPVGRACVVPELGTRVVTSVDNVIFRPNQDTDSKFLVFRFASADYLHEMGNLASGATMQRVSRSEFGNLRLAIPPYSEQCTIRTYLEEKASGVDRLIKTADRAITLLQERRNALISAAVTGKIDVRGLDV